MGSATILARLVIFDLPAKAAVICCKQFNGSLAVQYACTPEKGCQIMLEYNYLIKFFYKEHMLLWLHLPHSLKEHDLVCREF